MFDEESGRIEYGDTMSAIAKQLDMPMDQLIAANAGFIRDPNYIQAGWALQMPKPEQQQARSSRYTRSVSLEGVIHHVSYEAACVTAQCMVHQANMDWSRPENSAYGAHLNSKARRDAANALTLVAFRTPVSFAGKTASVTADGLTVTDAYATRDPSQLAGVGVSLVVTSRARSLGMSEATSTRMGIFSGVGIQQSVDRMPSSIFDERIAP